MQGQSPVGEALEAFQRGDLQRARRIADRQLAVAPSPQLQHLVGLIECRLGRPELGVDWLHQALDAEPGNIPFRVMLARALLDSRRAAEALDVATKPAGTSPPELALWQARAEAADAAQAWDASADAWRRLCATGVGDWQAFGRLGNALTALGRWPEAVAAFERALELNPHAVPLRRSLATALARCGRYNESADELRRWVEASPPEPAVRITFARLLADLGRHEEAMAELRRAATLACGTAGSIDTADPMIAMAAVADGASPDVPTLQAIAHVLERTGRAGLLTELLDQAEAAGIAREQLGYPAAAAALGAGDPSSARRILLAQSSQDDPVRWHWLMARIADALGDSDTAYAEAEAMNRCVNDHDAWRRRGAQHLAWVRSLAGVLTQEWTRRLHPVAAGERRSPAFLVGFPRSGTTLLDTFLMGHPHIEVLEEPPTIAAVEKVIGDIAHLPDASAGQLEQAREAYFAEVDRQADRSFAGLVVDKQPLNMLALPYVHCLFPDARILFAQRHPCDAVLSCFMQAFALNPAMACFLDLEDAAAFYDAAMQTWVRSLELLPVAVRSLVYEDLVVDPEAQLRPAVDFLGLDWRPELLDHQATAALRGAIGTPSYGQVARPLSRSASGRWRRYEKQLDPVLPVLLPWAKRLGYVE